MLVLVQESEGQEGDATVGEIQLAHRARSLSDSPSLAGWSLERDKYPLLSLSAFNAYNASVRLIIAYHNL